MLSVNSPIHNALYPFVVAIDRMVLHELVHITKTLEIVVFEIEFLSPSLITNDSNLVLICWVLKLKIEYFGILIASSMSIIFFAIFSSNTFFLQNLKNVALLEQKLYRGVKNVKTSWILQIQITNLKILRLND